MSLLALVAVMAIALVTITWRWRVDLERTVRQQEQDRLPKRWQLLVPPEREDAIRKGLWGLPVNVVGCDMLPDPDQALLIDMYAIEEYVSRPGPMFDRFDWDRPIRTWINDEIIAMSVLSPRNLIITGV